MLNTVKQKNKLPLGLLIIGIVFTALFIHFYLPRFIIEMKNPVIVLYNSKYGGTATQPYKEGNNIGKFIRYDSFDGISLEAYLTYAKTDSTKGTVIMLHGIRGSKAYFFNLSNTIAKKGYNAVALDLRAHGFSGGRYSTFGVKEQKDVVALIDYLIKEEGIQNNIGIWGQSLGGAMALQTLAFDERLKFGIIESTFSNFNLITNDYAKQYLGFSISAFTNYQVKRAGKIAGFDPDKANPAEACKKIEQPVLMVHGAKDKRIKIEYGRQNFEQLKSDKKQFYEIPNGNHYNIWQFGGEPYFEKVFKFMEDCVR